jgi:MFS family permease
VGLAVTATVAGLLKLPSNISSLIAAPLSGWIASKSGARVALFIGALIGAGGWGALLIFHATAMQVVLGAVVCAFAATMLLAAIPNLVLEGAPLERSSEVTGMTAVFRHMASGVGAQLITLLLATSRVTEPATGATFPDDAAYRLTFGYIAVTALMIAGLCLFLKNATVKAKEAPAPAGRRSPAE